MAGEQDKDQDKKRSDEAEAIRFLLIKAAIFILIPLAAAGLAVMFLMPKGYLLFSPCGDTPLPFSSPLVGEAGRGVIRDIDHWES